MPRHFIDGKPAYSVMIVESHNNICPEYQQLSYGETKTKAPRSESLALVSPNEPFHIIIMKHEGVLHQDMEVKAWHDKQPTEALAWQALRGKNARPANLVRQQRRIKYQYVKHGELLYAQGLQVDSRVHDEGWDKSKIVVHLTKGAFTRELAMPDPSIIIRGSRADDARLVADDQYRFCLTTRSGLRHKPFVEFVIRLRSREQLLQAQIIPRSVGPAQKETEVNSTQETASSSEGEEEERFPQASQRSIATTLSGPEQQLGHPDSSEPNSTVRSRRQERLFLERSSPCPSGNEADLDDLTSSPSKREEQEGINDHQEWAKPHVQGGDSPESITTGKRVRDGDPFMGAESLDGDRFICDSQAPQESQQGSQAIILHQKKRVKIDSHGTGKESQTEAPSSFTRYWNQGLGSLAAA